MNECKYCGYTGTNKDMEKHAGEMCWEKEQKGHQDKMVLGSITQLTNDSNNSPLKINSELKRLIKIIIKYFELDDNSKKTFEFEAMQAAEKLKKLL